MTYYNDLNTKHIIFVAEEKAWDDIYEETGDYYTVVYENEDGKIEKREWLCLNFQFDRYIKSRANFMKYKYGQLTVYVNPDYISKIEFVDNKAIYKNMELPDGSGDAELRGAGGFSIYEIIKNIKEGKLPLIRDVYREIDEEILVTETGKIKINLDDILFIEDSAVWVLENDRFLKYDLSKVLIEFEKITSDDNYSKKFKKISDSISVKNDSKLDFIGENGVIIIDKKFGVQIPNDNNYHRLERISELSDELLDIAKEYKKIKNQKYLKSEADNKSKQIFDLLCDASINMNSSPKNIIEIILTIGFCPLTILKDYNLVTDYEAEQMYKNRLIVDKIKIDDCDVFSINFKTYEEYEKLLYSDQKPENIYKIKDTKLVYDLDEVSSPDTLDCFLDSLCDYIKMTKNARVKKLFEKSPKEIKVSKILQAIDGGEVFYYSDGDLDLFHSTVTKSMLSAGYLIDYPVMWFKVEKTYMLRLDTVKYILANWNWISWIYDSLTLEKFIKEYGELSLRESAIEEDVLRRALVTKYLETVDSWNKFDNRLMDIITGERNPFFEENGFADHETTTNTTLENSL